MAFNGLLERDRGLREIAPIDASIGIVDFGGQLTGNIDRVVRENGVRSEIVPHDVAYDALSLVKGHVLGGGPDSVYQRGAPRCDREIIEDEKPVLAICYGYGRIVQHYGGKMKKLSRREDGPRTITHDNDSLFAGTPNEQTVWMAHGDTMTEVPEGFDVIAWSGDLPAAIENRELGIYATQFHPEADHTEYGSAMFRNYLLNIVGVEQDFTLEDQITESTAILAEKFTDGRKALLAISGGVDSSVAAKLLEKLGIGYSAFHIDHGAMRKGESAQVLKALADAGVEVTVVDAANEFFAATTTVKRRFIGTRVVGPLCEVTNPEHKRVIMGDKFIEVFGRKITETDMEEETVLVQGSIRPDKIESGVTSKKSAKIKTHHNASPAALELIEQGRVAEPLQHLYKDQVRAIAKELGLPDMLVKRQPFPGPGLAIRILCDSDFGWLERRRLGRLQDKLDDFLPRSMRGVVLRQKLVGVQGDDRTYKPSVGLPSSVSWKDAMELAQEIPEHIHGLNRVLRYIDHGDISQGWSATRTRVNPETVSILQDADLVTDTIMRETGENRGVSQFPVMLSYLNFGQEGRRSTILRPFITKDFMTGRPAVPGEDISEEVVERIAAEIIFRVPNIVRVGYDGSTKPPGTTEGE